ncbi:hypothetical protein [Listeria costaricensis]|uniref:hypothetical protein n=1 Tax=Listeria costaricensis TaxID=2026604 RepID=UPI000C07F1BE|nr:hypothetical protein [Listeria costaricensis]
MTHNLVKTISKYSIQIINYWLENDVKNVLSPESLKNERALDELKRVSLETITEGLRSTGNRGIDEMTYVHLGRCQYRLGIKPEITIQLKNQFEISMMEFLYQLKEEGKIQHTEAELEEYFRELKALNELVTPMILKGMKIEMAWEQENQQTQ